MDQVQVTPTAQDLVKRGSQLATAGKLAEAIDLYQQAIKLDPQNVWAYQYWGEALVRQNKLDAAAKCYRQAIKIDTDFCWSYNCLGQVLLWQGKVDESIAASRQAVKIDATKADFHYQLGQALVKKGELELASSAYQSAIKIKPDFDQACQRLESVLKQLDRVIKNPPPSALSTTHKETAPQPVTSEMKQSPKTQLAATSNLEKSSPIDQLRVLTNQQYLAQLYNSTPKLLTIAGNEQHLTALNSLSGLAVYEVHLDHKSHSALIVPRGAEVQERLVEIQWAPGFFLGFLVGSAQEQQQLKALKEWWSSKLRAERLPPDIVLKPEPEQNLAAANLWQILCSLLLQENSSIAQRITGLQKQYLQLRTLHENVQNSFAAVEDYLTQAKLPSLQLAFENQPDKGASLVSLSKNQQPVAITQLLPIASRGLAGIELHIAKAYSEAQGKLLISLRTPENNSCLAQWEIPYQHLAKGWLKLDLPTIDIGYQKDVELVLESISELGTPPFLSSGRIQPVPDAQAVVDGEPLERSLALRLWQGLPGSRRVISPYSLKPDPEEPEAGNLESTGYLGEQALSSVVAVTPNLPTDDFAYVDVIDDGAKILTHPRREGEVTIAMLPFCFPPGANQLVATLATENADASCIEYAMALVAEGVDPASCLGDDDFTTALASSGWLRVEPEQQHQINLSIQPAADRYYHIVLASRLPEDGYFDHAWARWLNFRITTESSATKQPETTTI